MVRKEHNAHIGCWIRCLSIVTASFAGGVSDGREQSEPVTWNAYSKQEFAKHLDEGSKPVILLVTADWTISTSIRFCQITLEVSRFRQVVRENDVVLMHANVTTTRARESIFADLSNITGRKHRTAPFLIAFARGKSRTPHYFCFPFTEKDHDRLEKIVVKSGR